MNNSASIQLAASFPPSRGYRGAETTIRDLERLYADNLCICNGIGKHRAFWLLMGRNMERAEGYGKGNKSESRAHQIKLNACYNS